MRSARNIGDLYQEPLVSVDLTESLYDAATKMQFHEIGALAVFDGLKLVGIITEHDLVQALADEIDLTVTEVSQYTSPGPATVDITASVADAAATMVRIGARHLPVIKDGALVGMLSSRDLLVALGQKELNVRVR